MPDISQLLAIQDRNDRLPGQYISQLTSTLGDILAQRGQRGFEDSASKFFTENDVTPQNLEQFSAMYPNLPKQEIWKYASQIDNQKTQQGVKDLGASFFSAYSTGAIKGPKDIGDFFDKSGASPSVRQAALPVIMKFMQDNASIFKKEGIKLGPGESYNVPDESSQTGFRQVMKNEKEPESEMLTIYGPDGQTRRVSAPKGSSYTPPSGWSLQAPVQAKPYEVNVASDLDTFLLGKYEGYATDKSAREKALKDYASNKALQNEYRAWWTERKQTAPPIYNFVQTSEGIIPGNIRTGRMGAPSSGQSGQLYGKPLPADAMAKIGELSTLIDQTQIIKDSFKPDYVGPVGGRYGSIKEKLVDLPENQVTFYAAVRNAKDALLRARSGAQINEQEYKRLVAFLPDENLPSGNFKARLAGFETLLKSTINNKLNVLNSSGYGKVEQQPTSTGPKDVVKTGTYNGKTVYKLKNGSTVYQDGTPVR